MENFGLLLRLCLAISLAVSCFAQSTINLPPINVRGQVTSQGIDATGGTTKPVQYGTATPGTCTVWSMYIVTTETPGENVYLCTSSNVWTRLKMNGAESILSFTSPLNRATNTISLLGWGSGSRPVMAGALGVSGNCAQWGAAGLTDTGAPCGSGGGSGANALGYYLVNQATDAPSNAINLGLLSSGLLKIAVSGGVATFSTAVGGTDFVLPADSRLTDARTPTAHASSHLSSGADPIAAATPTVRGSVTTTTATPQVVSTDDSRMTNARTPTAHAASHQTGGSDEIATATPASNAIPKAGSGGKLATGWVDYTGYVPTTRTVNGKALSSDIVLSNTDVGALAVSGTAAAATKLATSRTINGVGFDGTANITVPFTSSFVDAKSSCGLVMDGTTDDTTALSNCINALPAEGGTILFPSGTAIIGNLTITKSYVQLKGTGNSTGWNNSGGSTILKYPAAGTIGGFVLRFIGTGSGTSALTNIGSGIDGIHIDAVSRAANGLWLTNVYMFKGVNWSIANTTGGYALVLDATGILTLPRCGDGGGGSFLDNFNIWSASGGIILGTASYDVCSFKIGKGIIFWGGVPPYHGIYGKFLDSSTFGDVQTLELSSLTVSGVSCTSNVCTVTTSTPHLISGVQGVWMRGGSNTLLNGSFAATSTGTYTFTIPVTIANGSYTATYANAVGVALGTSGCAGTALGCAWDNWFGALLSSTGVYEFDNYGSTSTFNTISSWNWYETAPGGSDTYGRPGKMAALDVKGGIWNYTIKTSTKFQVPFPVLKGIDFQAGSIVDYGVGIDFANSTPGSAGYNAIRMANNTSIAAMNYGASATLIILGADTDSNIALGNTSNASTTKLVAKNHLQLAALTAPTCNAANRGTFNYVANGAGFKDILYVCTKDAAGTYFWFNIY